MRRRLTCALCGRGQEVGTCTQAADLLPPLPAPHPGARRAVWLCKIGVAGRGGGEVPAASRQAVQTTLGPWHPTPKRTLKISKGHKSRFLGPQQGTPRKGSTVAMRWVRLRVRGKAEACAPPGFPSQQLTATLRSHEGPSKSPQGTLPLRVFPVPCSAAQGRPPSGGT